jgi:hypothetical protein
VPGIRPGTKANSIIEVFSMSHRDPKFAGYFVIFLLGIAIFVLEGVRYWQQGSIDYLIVGVGFLILAIGLGGISKTRTSNHPPKSAS